MEVGRVRVRCKSSNTCSRYNGSEVGVVAISSSLASITSQEIVRQVHIIRRDFVFKLVVDKGIHFTAVIHFVAWHAMVENRFASLHVNRLLGVRSGFDS